MIFNVMYPAQLPMCPLVEGYTRQETDRAIRTEMDAGLPKVRNQLTATHTLISERYACTPEQLDLLDYFFKTTTKNGSMPFWKYDFFYDTYRRCHFLSPPGKIYLSNNLCVFTLNLVMQETKTSSFLTSTIYPIENKEVIQLGVDLGDYISLVQTYFETVYDNGAVESIDHTASIQDIRNVNQTYTISEDINHAASITDIRNVTQAYDIGVETINHAASINEIRNVAIYYDKWPVEVVTHEASITSITKEEV